ncbi:MAG: hypothetical protein GKR93_10610 [Gammaproteobacteria bacterium]|nr:hypothetical protein [Gammaproteobacteria bacterium]
MKSTNDFLNNESFLTPDSVTGWRNRASTHKAKWRTDSYGSRSSSEVSLTRNNNYRIMFLGSSMINGGTHVENYETISAYLENEEIETLNFGTMLYGLDQSFLLYTHNLKKFNPDIIIIGLDSNPVSVLGNLYIPFRDSREVNMPFLKPRYELKNSSLELVRIDPSMLQNITSDSSILSFLSRHDDFYTQFSLFKHLGITPIANLLNSVRSKTESLRYYLNTQTDNTDLLLELMETTVSTIEGSGKRVIFIYMPNRADIEPGRLMGKFPDRYGIRQKLFKDNGFPVVSVRDIFLQSGIKNSIIYSGDNQHYTAVGNRIIAEHLEEIILLDTEDQTLPGSRF